MKQLLAEVKANYLVAEHTYVMEIHTPEIAPHVRPANFFTFVALTNMIRFSAGR